MRVIIAGSRDIVDIDEVIAAIEGSGFEITKEVCGCARGVDTLGRLWAEGHGIPVKRFEADWCKWGTGAGTIRNVEMADYAEALIAVMFRGRTPGTSHMIWVAKEKGLKVHVRLVDK